MPGFLGEYDGTDRIKIDDEEMWWVDVKKCLSVAESEEAERALSTIGVKTDKTGKNVPDIKIDLNRKQFEQVVASIVDWNLSDRNAVKLPTSFDRDLERIQRDQLTNSDGSPRMGADGFAMWMSPRRKSLLQIPQRAYDQIQKRVDVLNGPKTPEQEYSFQAGNGSSPQRGQDNSSDDHQVLDRGAVPVPTGDPGGPPPAD
jgi:hypothetical protein